jgi:hypothetical protein
MSLAVPVFGEDASLTVRLAAPELVNGFEGRRFESYRGRNGRAGPSTSGARDRAGSQLGSCSSGRAARADCGSGSSPRSEDDDRSRLLSQGSMHGVRFRVRSWPRSENGE